MKHLKLFENTNNKSIYILDIKSSFFTIVKMKDVSNAFTSSDDVKNFVINFTNDFYDKLNSEDLLTENEEKCKLETYKDCQDFFKDIHNDGEFQMFSDYTFKISKYELIENVDTPEIRKLKKDSDRYNI